MPAIRVAVAMCCVVWSEVAFFGIRDVCQSCQCFNGCCALLDTALDPLFHFHADFVAAVLVFGCQIWSVLCAVVVVEAAPLLLLLALLLSFSVVWPCVTR